MSIDSERTKRILTTHVGSLPRPDSLSAMMVKRLDGQSYDQEAYDREVAGAVADTVAWQCDLGIDIVSDGEQSKAGFFAYVRERLSGVEPNPDKKQREATRERNAFPEFYAAGHSGTQPPGSLCTGAMKYTGQEQVKTDIENLKKALEGRNVADVFIPCASIGTVEGAVINKHYASEDEYLEAIGEAMREEYEAIVNAGFSIQLDDPRLAMHHMLNPDMSIDDARKWARKRVAAMNHAMRNIPSNRVRHHTCYGINMGPRTFDMEMKHLIDIILEINADYYSFEFGNPRHEHEWKLWEDVKMPEGKAVLPGMVTHASVLVEHPELVAERIVRFAGAVGKQNVIASTDCGFASTPRAIPEVPQEIVTAKFQSLVEGARLASKQLF